MIFPVSRYADADAELESVITQSTPIDSPIAVGHWMQQTPHPLPGIFNQSQEGAMVETWKWLRARFDLGNRFLECIDAVNCARKPGEPSGPLHQQGLQYIRRWFGNVIKPAAGPAGDIGAHLTQVDMNGFVGGLGSHGGAHTKSRLCRQAKTTGKSLPIIIHHYHHKCVLFFR